MSADHAHGADHGHGGSRFIQHHYDDAQHQFDSGKLGIWLFLGQEVLFFSALFVAYVLYRFHHPEIYGYAHKYLDVKFGAINTGVLIFSSLTAAWAVRAAQLGQRKLLIGCLAATILCALTFLGIKYIEYTHKIHEQILFGGYFDPCVSSGNNPLLTKKNTCPGHQGSVWWEDKIPQTGCYPEIAIDQNPNKPGPQFDCTVRETVLGPRKIPKLQARKDKDGKEVKNAKGETEMEPVKKSNGRLGRRASIDGNVVTLTSPGDAGNFKPGMVVIVGVSEGPLQGFTRSGSSTVIKVEGDKVTLADASQIIGFGNTDDLGEPELTIALDANKKWLFDEDAKGAAEILAEAKQANPKFTTLKQCPPATMHGHHEPEVYPCWKAAPQPAVCRPGFYYITTCDAAGRCSMPDTGVKPFEISKRYADPKECEDERFDRLQDLKKIKKEETAKGLSPYGLTIGDCGRSSAIGFVVEHGDHHVHNTRCNPLDVGCTQRIAVAECKAPAPPAKPSDMFSDVVITPKLGEKAIDLQAEPDEHAEHDALYLGPPPEHTNMFFTIYFAMTGLHGIHVLVGVFVFIWLLIRAIKGHFTPDYFGPIDFAALYWHIVDLIWIFLFPLLYLIH